MSFGLITDKETAYFFPDRCFGQKGTTLLTDSSLMGYATKSFSPSLAVDILLCPVTTSTLDLLQVIHMMHPCFHQKSDADWLNNKEERQK
jgi:hypothetical protein